MVEKRQLLLPTLPGIGLSWNCILLTQTQFFRYFNEKKFPNTPLTKHHFCYLVFCLLWQFFLQKSCLFSNLGLFLLRSELLEKMFEDDHVDLNSGKIVNSRYGFFIQFFIAKMTNTNVSSVSSIFYTAQAFNVYLSALQQYQHLSDRLWDFPSNTLRTFW